MNKLQYGLKIQAKKKKKKKGKENAEKAAVKLGISFGNPISSISGFKKNRFPKQD
jgi:hypothetical protein